jgi:hypothetical protein
MLLTTTGAAVGVASMAILPLVRERDGIGKKGCGFVNNRKVYQWNTMKIRILHSCDGNCGKLNNE